MDDSGESILLPGWHPTATAADLAAAAQASNAAAVSLCSRLVPAANHEGVGAADRLRAMAEVAAGKRERQFVAHLLTGAAPPKGRVEELVVMMLTILGCDLDLPEPVQRRLAALLQRATPRTRTPPVLDSPTSGRTRS